MKKTKQAPSKKNAGAVKAARARSSNRPQRQILRAMAGAVIGGVVAGPVGLAAGAIVGASVRRGPVKKKSSPVAAPKPPAKAKPRAKTKTPAKRRAAKRRFTDIYPNIP